MERRTVLHHVRPEQLGRVIEGHYWFCGQRHCPLVYYGEKGGIFETHELREPVGQKVTGDGSPACYCFGFTEVDIRKNISTTGKSSIPKIITEFVKAGMCACEIRNPAGSCCLGHVHEMVRRLQGEQSNISPTSHESDGCEENGCSMAPKNTT